MKKLAIIGDFNASSPSHKMTMDAIEQSAKSLQTTISYEWVTTDQIAASSFDFQGFWIAPGGPYKDMTKAMQIIEFARVNNIPTFGTCGGFQHMAIEFARNVLGIKDASHAEYGPTSSPLVVVPLTCNIKSKTLEVELCDKASAVYSIMGANKIYEKYYCSFGISHDYMKKFHERGFESVGVDKVGESRILELKGHKFFIATLFMPQALSMKNQTHPLVDAFVKSI